MAQEVFRIVHLDGSNDVETISYSADGKNHEIKVYKEDAPRFHEVLDPLTQQSRSVERHDASAARRKKRRRSEGNDGDVSTYKWSALWVVLAALITVLTVVVICVVRYGASKDAAAVVTAGASVIGTLVGAFYGMNVGSAVGSAGRQDAEQGRQQAEQKKDEVNVALNAAMSALSPDHEVARGVQRKFLATIPPASSSEASNGGTTMNSRNATDDELNH